MRMPKRCHYGLAPRAAHPHWFDDEAPLDGPCRLLDAMELEPVALTRTRRSAMQLDVLTEDVVDRSSGVAG